jgi:hypothetical protein
MRSKGMWILDTGLRDAILGRACLRCHVILKQAAEPTTNHMRFGGQ